MLRVVPFCLSVSALATVCTASLCAQQPVLTGQNAFTDYSKEKPGVRRHLTVADLPQPMPDTSVDNGGNLVAQPNGAWPQAPAGFKVERYAQGNFKEPRLIRTAPNGDLFLADSHGDKVWVLRGVGSTLR